MSSPGAAEPSGRRSAEIGLVLVAGFALAMLLPIAVTPFLGDDTFNSYINGAMGYGHKTFWVFISDLNSTWIHNGRFFPGALLESYGLFHIMPSLRVYKLFQITITLANVVTFFVLMRELRVPRSIALLGTLVLVSSFQMRQYHDGLLGFSGNIEFIMELMLLSLLGLIVSFRRNALWPLAGSLAAYAVGLLTYEVTYLMWLAFLAVLLVEQPWRRALRSIAPYAALSAVVIGVQLYVKAHANIAADADYNVRLNAASLMITFCKQLVAAIPLTYVAIDPSNLFGHGATVFATVPVWIRAAVFTLAATAAWVSTAAIDALGIDRRSIRSLAAAGVILWLTPALLVASSARYQRELVFGLGHVPVYLEYFGVTMIALALFSSAVVRWGAPNRWVRGGVAVAIGLLAVTIYASNAIVISMSQGDKQALLNMDAALNAGILRSVPDSAELFVDGSIAPNRYLDESTSDAKYYYFYHTNRRFDVHSIGSLPRVTHCSSECRSARSSYELLNVPVGEQSGYVVLGHLDRVATQRGNVRSFATEVTLFVRGVPATLPLWVRFTQHGCGPDKPMVSRLVTLHEHIATTTIASRCGSIEMSALAVSLSPSGYEEPDRDNGMEGRAGRRSANR